MEWNDDKADTLCPITGNRECPELVKLHRNFVGNQEQVEPDVAARDRTLYNRALLTCRTELARRCCEGMVGEVEQRLPSTNH